MPCLIWFSVARMSSSPACFHVRGLLSELECDHIVASADTTGMVQATTNGGDGRHNCGVAWLPVERSGRSVPCQTAASIAWWCEQIFLTPEAQPCVRHRRNIANTPQDDFAVHEPRPLAQNAARLQATEHENDSSKRGGAQHAIEHKFRYDAKFTQVGQHEDQGDIQLRDPVHVAQHSCLHRLLQQPPAQTQVNDGAQQRRLSRP